MNITRLGKGLWYLVALVLLLSLPTFSYLVPDPARAVGAGPAKREPAGVQPPLSVESLSRAAPAAAFPSLRSRPFPPTIPSVATLRGRERLAQAFRAAVQEAGQRVPTPAGVLSMAPSTFRSALVAPRASNRNRRPFFGDDRLAAELRGLDEGYDLALGNLFAGYALSFGGYGGNPFQEALTDASKRSGQDVSPPPVPPSPPPPPAPAGGDPAPPPTDGGSSSGDQGSSALKRLSYLVVGEIEGTGSGVGFFRAYRDDDGSLVAAGKIRVNPLYGVVSGARPFLVVGASGQLLTCDLDGDRILDAVIANITSQGTLVEMYTGDGSGGFKYRASGFFLWKAVASFGVLDFNGDGESELAVLFRGSPNLFVYERTEGEYRYVKEVVLPFEPGLVVDADFSGLVKEHRLYVFDSGLRRTVALTSVSPQVLLQGLYAPLERFREVFLESEPDGPGEAELVLFDYAGRLTVAERKQGGLVLHGGFDFSGEIPLILFGDLLGAGSRQLFCLP